MRPKKVDWDQVFDAVERAEAERAEASANLCPLCLRPIPPEARSSLHHLTPVLKGGRNGPTARLHQICHNEIHSTLTEAELARGYATFEALRAHPALARFIAWIATKPPTFHGKTVGNHRKRKRGKRRR